MIRGTLLAVLGFAARQGAKEEAYSYQNDGKWYIVTTGPRHCNLIEVTEYNDQEEKLLLDMEDKAATDLHSEPDT